MEVQSGEMPARLGRSGEKAGYWGDALTQEPEGPF